MLETFEALRIVNWVSAHQNLGCTSAVLALCGTNDAVWIEDVQMLLKFAHGAPESFVEGHCESCRMVWPLKCDRPRKVIGAVLRQ